MLEIAIRGDSEGIYQKEISENQEISYKYLDQIINSLKIAGLITKVGGRKSGYVLTRPPENITIFDIHNAFESGICVVDCMDLNYVCDREKQCAIKGFWGDLNNQVITYFKTKTLKDLLDEQDRLCS
jgi:Rrf2 family protein